MLLLMRTLLAVAVLAYSAIVQGQGHNCDCTVITGSCEAAIMVEPTGGQGSYGANLHIRSSAPICSKVDYFVDSTSYFTILSQGNSLTDRVFGTAPVTNKTISDVRCRTCKIMNASIAPSDKTADQQQVDLSGAWTTFERCSGNVTGSGQLVLTKTNDGYSVTGKFSNVTVRTGTVSNGAVTIVAANWANRVHYDGKVVDPRRIEGRYSQTVGEWNCTWHATKAD